ncbi:MAG: SpoIIE family protein phosphatase [Planctomycetes bacterium]|nr:SpoIIE family protein phosphatase [Planctomycetota bacterium]
MTIRNKLLILLLGISLIPLVAYLTLDISLSRIVRNRIENTLRSALDERARSRLVETIEHYDDTLKISAQAVRYGLRHYADQVQRCLWSVDISTEQPPSGRYLITLSSEDISREAQKYHFVNSSENQKLLMDFTSQLIYPPQNVSKSPLWSQLSQLTKICKDIYAVNPESKLWIYTVLADGSAAMYPSCGFWPYSAGYDLRQQPWYINAQNNNQLTPTLRIDPLTGRTVMTVAMPFFEQDNSFAGVIALDIDLSGVLDRMYIPEEWKKDSWKLLIRLPEDKELYVNEAKIICCTTFMESQQDLEKPSKLLDICDPNNIREMLENAIGGNSGFMRLPYNGVDSLWAYGTSQQGGGFPILVVPYQRIIEQANSAQQMLFRDNVRAMQIATFLIFIVIVAAVVLAVIRARKLTVPITHLADAAGKLAQGDFDTRVDIRTGDEFQQLGDIFNETGPKLKAMEKMKGSLELARAIQQNLLPGVAPKIEGFELAGNCKYCDETGGDYYDFIELPELGPGIAGIALGDVTGHGIGAALLMATARSILRSNAQRYGTNLTELFEILNRNIESDTDYDKFITLFYGILDANQKSLVWVSGGHDPALWYHKSNGKIEELPNTGMPVGIMQDSTFEQGGPVSLMTGDIIVIGTDGIWEAQNEGGEMFGKERLHKIIIRESENPTNEICSQIIEDVTNFSSPTPQLDDITLVVIKSV